MFFLGESLWDLSTGLWIWDKMIHLCRKSLLGLGLWETNIIYPCFCCVSTLFEKKSFCILILSLNLAHILSVWAKFTFPCAASAGFPSWKNLLSIFFLSCVFPFRVGMSLLLLPAEYFIWIFYICIFFIFMISCGGALLSSWFLSDSRDQLLRG